MFKKVIVIIFIGLIFGSCNTENQKKSVAETPETNESVTKVDNYIPIGQFEEKAGEFVNKPVVVQGIVDHLCKHGAKRLLLVNDDGDVHVDAEERFDEKIEGSELKLTGIVAEFRVDEAYCLQMEEDNVQQHREGKIDKEYYEGVLEDIKYYRDSMKVANSDHLSYYSLDYVSHEEIK